MGIQPGHIHKPGRIGTRQNLPVQHLVGLIVARGQVSSRVLGR